MNFLHWLSGFGWADRKTKWNPKRQGRLHAHVSQELLRRQRHRRRANSPRHRHRSGPQVQKDGQSLRDAVRRRSRQSGPSVWGIQHCEAMGSPGDLRVRKQRIRHGNQRGTSFRLHGVLHPWRLYPRYARPPVLNFQQPNHFLVFPSDLFLIFICIRRSTPNTPFSLSLPPPPHFSPFLFVIPWSFGGGGVPLDCVAESVPFPL